MKPTVMASANANPGGGSANAAATHTNGITIPINHEYGHHPQQQQQQYADPNSAAYGSPRQQQQAYNNMQQQQPHPQQQQPHGQQIPAHFQQGFGFEPDMDMDMDMFPRSRLGRMHDPFAGFGASHFNFPQFGSMGRRRPAADTMTGDDDDDFFNRLPSQFRQYIPDGFATTRRGVPPQYQQQQAAAPQHVPQPHQQQQHVPAAHQQQHPQQQQQYYPQQGAVPPQHMMPPQSPSKKLCDAAIQTEDPMGGRSEVDHSSAGAMQTDNLNQHGLRNTMDLGVKSMNESDQGPRSHSAPPPEQLQQQQQHYQQQQQIPVNNGGRRVTPPQQQHSTGFGTQTTPPVGAQPQSPLYHKSYYAPHPQPHPQQKQQSPPPPQTPGGTYIRTIPIFVEGRSEPIFNHKEIPNQNAPPSAAAQAQASARAQAQVPTQQQQRPTPLNTQQQQQHPQQEEASGVPPQTPHTVDSINKIQDIQRDVLDLMSKVEQFKGTRQEKEYAYLDEMLTRNLLKLDTIDTNGKESIRMARKEAIKCIQASINVLEAKAEENTRAANASNQASTEPAAVETQKSNSKDQVADNNNTADVAAPVESSLENANDEAASAKQEAIPLPPAHPTDATQIHEPIPLPAPEGSLQTKEKSPSPAKEQESASGDATTAAATVEKSSSASSQK